MSWTRIVSLIIKELLGDVPRSAGARRADRAAGSCS